jgi:hypothetical protein
MWMPLERSKEGFSSTIFNAVEFWMRDKGNIKAEYSCKVSREALNKLFQKDHSGGTASLVDADQAATTFEQHRDDIERIASAKFDAGEKGLVVSLRDVDS